MKYLFLFLTSIILIHSSNSQTLTALQAYDEVTKYRDSADQLWDHQNPSKEELYQSIQLLNKGLAYLDQANIWDLAQGNIYLKFRRTNILMDLVHIYHLLGNSEKAITAMEDMIDVGGYYVDFITKDSSLNDLKSNPRYIQLIKAADNAKSLWQSEALQTPYTKDIPLNEKIAGLSLLWSQAKYNFVHFDHANLDWNRLYLDYLNEISKTSSTAEYYKLLVKFYAALKDGHTNVYFPKELQKEFYSRPPFRTAFIEGKVFISEVLSDSLEKAGIKRGMEVLSIDHIPVLKYAKDEVEPYQSSSTPQDLEIRTFTYALLAGSENKPLVLEVKDRNGKVFSKTISRSGYHDIKSTPSIQYQEINHISYLVINNFEDDHIKKQFDSLFNQISQTKGLIIDLRKNGGGSSDIGFHILASLTDTPFKISRTKVTQYNSRPFHDAQWYFDFPDQVNPNKKQFYSKPVIVLISARTFSAAEDFVVAFKYMHRGKLIGQATGGSTGLPLFFSLPGGGTARVCSKYDAFPDGEKFVGIGIQPDIYVKKTISGLMENKDEELVKAIKNISTQ